MAPAKHKKLSVKLIHYAWRSGPIKTITIKILLTFIQFKSIICITTSNTNDTDDTNAVNNINDTIYRLIVIRKAVLLWIRRRL